MSQAGSLATGGGTGDVVGPASATDHAIARWDTTSGKLLQNSGVIIDDSENISGIASLAIAINTGNTETHISITPNTPIAASQHWDGIVIDGAALDPSGSAAEIHPIHIDLSGVDLTNDPEIIGLRVDLPATNVGVEEKAGVYVSGWGYVAELVSGDHDAALRTVGPNVYDYDGTTLVAGQTKTQHLNVIQTAGSTGGEIHVVDVSKAGGGAVEVVGLSTGDDVAPIHQHVGTPVGPDYAWVVTSGPAYTDRTTEFGSAASDVQIFVADNDEIMIGGSAVFSDIEVILATASSQDIMGTFQYSIAGPAWTTFTPTDGTAGFRQNGTIEFSSGDLSGWAATTINGQNYYWIRIIRTRNNIVTPPTEDTIKISAPTLYEWDELGVITCKELKPDTDLAVQYGGTGASTLTGVLTGNGTSAISANAVTQYGVIVAGASNAVASLTPATNGKLLIGSTGANPSVAALASSGGTVAITNGAGTINLETVGGGFAWNVITDASETMVAGNGYIANRGTLVTLTLPAVAALGDAFKVINIGAGFVRIAQNASDDMRQGASTTTTGAGGYLQATTIGDAIEIVAIGANNYIASDAPQGGWTAV